MSKGIFDRLKKRPGKADRDDDNSWKWLEEYSKPRHREPSVFTEFLADSSSFDDPKDYQPRYGTEPPVHTG